MADTTTIDTTRERTTKRSFYNSKGEESARALPDTIGGRVTFVESDYTIDMVFTDIEGYDDIAEGVLRQAFAFGTMTSVTNTVGSSKLTLDEKIESAEARWESIKAGSWSAERESGPRHNDLVEAAARVQASLGKPWDDNARRAFMTRLANEEITPKQLQSNQTFKAAFDAIKLERAQERAAKSAAAAKDKPDNGLQDLLG